jgi:anti-sigma-K factor RskA
MSGTASCREIRHSLGVYVLGAIEPGDRAQVDEHLATCADCREELASLAGLPALLRRVPTAEAERLAVAEQAGSAETPPDHLLPALLARTAQTRRVRRWRELAAAAAVVVLALGAGAAGASLLGSGSSPTAPASAHGQVSSTWHTVSAVDAHTGAALTVKYASMHWGTTMAVQVAGVPSGTVCQFLVTDTQGHRFVVGGWRVEYQGRPVWYPASTSLTDTSLHSFQVTVGGKVLASVNAA